jgi:hypothetical protein
MSFHVIADFGHATEHSSNACPNTDLIGIGLVLLECMEGRSQSEEKRTSQHVKDERAMNRVFGLSEPGRWSGCKELIDFLDDLFKEDRSASAKIAKRVRISIIDSICIY